MTTILFIRHGNIERANIVPGRLPEMHLSEDGRRQAEHVAEMLSVLPLRAVCASPLERTIETALPIARKHNLDIIKRDNLIEIDFGEWSGKSFDELESDIRWKQFHQFRNGCPVPGGELMASVQCRMINEIFYLRERFEEGHLAVVSHHDPIKSVLAYFLGISLDMFCRIHIDTASISILEFDQDNNVHIKAMGLKENLKFTRY